jgi:hypothetical protein
MNVVSARSRIRRTWSYISPATLNSDGTHSPNQRLNIGPKKAVIGHIATQRSAAKLEIHLKTSMAHFIYL